MESDGEEEAAGTPGPTNPSPASGRLKGCPELSVDGDMREMAKTAAWSVSSCKPGNGVASLRDDSLDTYWQSVPYPTYSPSRFIALLPESEAEWLGI
jgi:anaphase-promoting complex subunit 10